MLSLDGVIWAKIVEGSFTKPLFHEFIGELLTRMQPFPGNNSVIVMDNARIHKNQEVIDMIEERYDLALLQLRATDSDILLRGMRVMFLPPYSPDYNPIELAFSSIKSFVRWDRTLGREDLDQEKDDRYVYFHLLDVAYSISLEKAVGYFHHCGYI